jgi:integrase/recombinase XerD
MTNEITSIEPSPQEMVVAPARTTDQQLIDLWLHGRCAATKRGYRAEVQRLLAWTQKALGETTLADLQGYADSLATAGLEPATRRRMLASVKSVFTFGHKLGYLPFDTARPLRLPPLRDTLAERILDESQVQRMLALERHPRNSVMLTLLYATGVRVSELCGLKWSDCCARNEGGQVSVFGKGAKTRAILIPAGVWRRLAALKGEDGADAPVFRSRKGGGLCPTQVLRIVKKAAARAGIAENVVVHTFRHSHASHALERGASVALVGRTLGHSPSSNATGRYLHARPNDSSSRYLPL